MLRHPLTPFSTNEQSIFNSDRQTDTLRETERERERRRKTQIRLGLNVTRENMIVIR